MSETPGMQTKVVNTETVASAIRKYIDIKHESIVETKVSAAASNTIEGDVVIARHGSDLTIEQANKLKQQVEVVYIYNAMNDVSEDELFVIESIRSRFADADGFWDEAYIRSLLGSEYDEAALELDLDSKQIKATFETGEIAVIPLDELEAKLVADYKHNENTFTQSFISNYHHSIDILKTAVKAVQSNRVNLKDVTLVESQVSWKQTNDSIQEVINKLDRVAEGLQEKVEAKMNEADTKIAEITTPEVEEKKSNFIYIVIVIIAAIIVSALFFTIFVLPSLRAGIGTSRRDNSLTRNAGIPKSNVSSTASKT